MAARDAGAGPVFTATMTRVVGGGAAPAGASARSEVMASANTATVTMARQVGVRMRGV